MKTPSAGIRSEGDGILPKGARGQAAKPALRAASASS
jgi:hypothetical protein